MRVETFILVKWLHGDAPPDAWAHNLAGQDASLRAYDGPALDACVVSHPDLTADDGIVFNHGAAGDSSLRGDDYALANQDVMRYLDQIIYLRRATDARLAQRAAINASVGPYLHVVINQDGPSLREFVAKIIFVRDVTEAVSADDDARVQAYASAQSHALVNHHVRVDDAIGSDVHIVADDSSRTDLRARAYTRSLAYVDAWANKDALVNCSALRDDGSRMNRRLKLRGRVQEFGYQREGEFGLRRFDKASGIHTRARRYDEAGSKTEPRVCKQLAVFDKSYLAIYSALKAGDRFNRSLAIAMKATTNVHRKFRDGFLFPLRIHKSINPTLTENL
jgi:hypothetical protein